MTKPSYYVRPASLVLDADAAKAEARKDARAVRIAALNARMDAEAAARKAAK